MNDRFLFWLGYPVVVIAVFWIGWKQPLRYRFMTRQEIMAAEGGVIRPGATPVEVAATPKPTPWMWDRNRPDPLKNPNR